MSPNFNSSFGSRTQRRPINEPIVYLARMHFGCRRFNSTKLIRLCADCVQSHSQVLLQQLNRCIDTQSIVQRYK